MCKTLRWKNQIAIFVKQKFFDVNADDVLTMAPDQAFSLHNSIQSQTKNLTLKEPDKILYNKKINIAVSKRLGTERNDGDSLSQARYVQIDFAAYTTTAKLPNLFLFISELLNEWNYRSKLSFFYLKEIAARSQVNVPVLGRFCSHLYSS